ncbi:uncharacterized protein LOC142237043 [Haematobia irritans]|uniref:uncharacterized protein LOC142237043 n=1 Tax=Haematobia irritans TaxID=7368 RepID=UPI003F50530E
MSRALWQNIHWSLVHAVVMRTTFISLAFVQVVLLCGLVRPDSWTANGTIVNRYDAVVKRQKRFLVFEKGAAITLQGNNAKAVLSGVPRGLNVLFEYTIFYELPTGLDLSEKTNSILKNRGTTTITTTTSTTKKPPDLLHFPYIWMNRPVNSIEEPRRYSKCTLKHFYETNAKYPPICLRRIKRVSNFHRLSVSQRLFYDILEKWSQLHGFLPRYCFMRTLCEARHLLLPYGHSLLHDIIQIFLSYTIPWAMHHETFGQSLNHHHSINDCSRLYGSHCRVSWLSFVTTSVHGSMTDFIEKF